MKTTSLLVALAFALPCAADDDQQPPANIAAYLIQRDQQSASEIKRLDSEIRRLGRDKSKSGRQLVSEWRKKRDALKKDSSGFVPEIPYALGAVKAGEIGRISKPVITAVNIIDGQNMLADMVWTYQQPHSTGPTSYVMQNERVVKRVWLRGFPTEKLANGSKVTIDGLAEVTGNQAYDTVSGGTETVFVIEPFDKNKLEPYLSTKRKKDVHKPTKR